eukprot:2533505-Rhodomonas_salina.5
MSLAQRGTDLTLCRKHCLHQPNSMQVSVSPTIARRVRWGAHQVDAPEMDCKIPLPKQLGAGRHT